MQRLPSRTVLSRNRRPAYLCTVSSTSPHPKTMFLVTKSVLVPVLFFTQKLQSVTVFLCAIAKAGGEDSILPYPGLIPESITYTLGLINTNRNWNFQKYDNLETAGSGNYDTTRFWKIKNYVFIVSPE